MGLRDPAQHAGGDDRAGQDAGAREGGELGRLLAQDRPDLVAGEPAPASCDVLVGDGRAAAAGVGADGDHEVGIDLAGQREGRVEAPGLLRGGKDDGGGVGVGVELLGHDDDVEPHAAQRVAADPPALAAHGGQDHPQGRGGAHARRPRRAVGVLLDHLGAEALPAGVRHGHPVQRADRGDPLGDLGVVGRHDPRAPTRAGHDPSAQVDRPAAEIVAAVRVGAVLAAAAVPGWSAG